MRPINLKITAFGSYTDTTEIDFTDLQSNLYLITGETGAGKTTIFDAIMFALYGSASGTGRKAEMMHSDAVEANVPTQVTLVFAHQGHKYTVERSMKVTKSRATGEYTLKSPEATLIEYDGNTMSGATKVTDRCEKLIGLNADQFRKIVMLAQGEFRQFLKANTRDRASILEKLFDNSEYKRFQALISGSRDQLKKEREQYSKAIEIALANFDKTGMSQEQEILYSPLHSELSANLDSLAEADAAELKTLKEERDRLQGEISKLDMKKGAASKDNDSLDELKDKRAHLSELQSKSEEMSDKKNVYENAEKAFHQIVPPETEKKNADAAVEKTKKNIELYQKQLKLDQEAVEQAQAASDAQQANRERISNLNTEISNIDKALPSYKKVSELEKKAGENAQEAEKAANAVKSAEEEQEKLKARKEQILTEVEKLAGIDGVVSDTQHEYEKADQALADLKAVKDQLNDIASDESVLRREQIKLDDLSKKAAAANDLHHNLYQRFIAGQSGLLAEKLQQDIEDNGESACPVCRTIFHKGSKYTFAARQAGTPSEKKVNEAKAAFDAAEKKRQEQNTRVTGFESTLSSKKEQAVEAAGKLLKDCTDWEMLSAPGYIDGKIDDFAESEKTADTRQKDAVKRRNLRDKLKKDEKTITEQLDILRNKIEGQQRKQNESMMEAENARTEASTLKGTLAYATEDEAKKASRAKADERKKLQEEVDKAEKTLIDARQKQDSTNGKLTIETNRLPDEKNTAAKAAEKLELALTKAGFPGLDAVHAALLPMEGSVPEMWLRGQSSDLSDYENDVKNTVSRIGELEVSTKDLHYTDLAELQEQLNERNKKYTDANSSCMECSKRADNHRRTADKVAEEKKHLAATDAMWKRLDHLADLATGAGGTGGMISFDRYVMGSVFEDILQMANARLDTMSGGQYELVHSEAAVRSNSQAGLDIEVLDHLTGKCRKADSLSGGEGFQASLALALGLSDVVQSRAGGTGIDALFIDEGFGSLDEGVLDKAIDVLKQLTDGNRLVGVISHVGRLEESITSKIVVTKPAGKGSCVRILN